MSDKEEPISYSLIDQPDNSPFTPLINNQLPNQQTSYQGMSNFNINNQSMNSSFQKERKYQRKFDPVIPLLQSIEKQIKGNEQDSIFDEGYMLEMMTREHLP